MSQLLPIYVSAQTTLLNLGYDDCTLVPPLVKEIKFLTINDQWCLRQHSSMNFFLHLVQSWLFYLVLEFTCGDNFTGTEGEFSSPGYPLSHYPSNIQCTWTVSTTEGSRIGIYHSDLDVEYHPSCDKDYLMVSSAKKTTYLLFFIN